MIKRQLSVLVALHGGTFSGVDTYAEQIAAVGADASHCVTLIGLGEGVAPELRGRIGSDRIRVVATGPLSRSGLRSTARLLPTFALVEMQAELGRTLSRLGERFDVAHLNHPALAGAARPHANRVVVAAWFYPHRPRARLVETWRHTGASFPKSAGLALKGLSHYCNDRQGYAASDCVVAPTELLAAHLETLGLPAIACPPPSRAPETSWDLISEDGRRSMARRVTICCGDLSHPRKNVRSAIMAVGLLASSGMEVELELIGRNADRLRVELGALPASVRVIAAGPLQRDQVHVRLRHSDVLLVPSLYEEWGYVATEAAVAGTPVVAFPVYPFVEILSAPLGVCAGDMGTDALAEALRLALESDATRAVVASIAERRFGAETVGRRLTEIWSGVSASAGEVVAAAGGNA